MQIEFSPTRNHSEGTESSASTALSQGSYVSPQPVVGLGQGSEKVCEIYVQSPPTITTGKRNRHLSGFPTSRFFTFLLPLRSALRKRGNLINPHRRRDETCSLLERTENAATLPQRHSRDPGSINPPTNALPSPKFSPHLSLSPVPLELRLEVETPPGNMRDGVPNVDTKPHDEALPQATSRSPSVVLSEGDSTPRRAHPNLPGRCVIAESALVHASSKQAALRDVLVESGYEGSYLIHVGFNQDMLGLNQGLLQEIYLFLDCNIESTCAKNIARTLDPFPVITYTPDMTYDYSVSEAEEEPWDLWVQHGVFCQEIRDHKPVETLAPSDTGTNLAYSTSSSSGGSGANGHSGNSGGRSSDSGTRRDNLGGADGGSREHSSRDGSGGSNDGDQDGTDDRVSFRVEDLSVRGHTTRQVSIPFRSTITLPAGGPRKVHTRYNTNACVEIKIEDNPDSQSPPPGQIWGSPWFEAKFILLDAEIHATSKGKPDYHLSLAQIRIMASGCDVSRLAYSPKIIRFDDGDLKSTTERARTVGGRATLGAAPTVRLDATIGRTTGEERSQNRWEVTSHQLPSDKTSAGELRTSTMWKYAHNNRHYTPGTQNDFEPKPSITFGLSRILPTLPTVEVEVVMDYSGPLPPQRFLEWFANTARPRSKKPLPAFSNFLHQVSVEVELEHVKERMECVAGLSPEDTYEVSQIGTEREPIYMPLESRAGRSNCEVLLRRALHGSIYLTQEQRDEHGSSSLPLALQTSFPTQDMLGVGLPTPSPSPTSSILVTDASVNLD